MQINTFSVVARCPRTGALGVAVTTAVPAVGAICPHVVPGLGAASTQAWVNPYLAIAALDRLRQGETAQDALGAVIAGDEASAVRQIGLVDAAGRAASFTGVECTPWCGHVTGEGYAIQGNMLTGPDVLAEMERAFRATAAEELAGAHDRGAGSGAGSRRRQARQAIRRRDRLRPRGLRRGRPPRGRAPLAGRRVCAGSGASSSCRLGRSSKAWPAAASRPARRRTAWWRCCCARPRTGPAEAAAYDRPVDGHRRRRPERGGAGGAARRLPHDRGPRSPSCARWTWPTSIRRWCSTRWPAGRFVSAFPTVTAAAAQMRAGSLSPVALMEASLDRIARLDPALHSFICLADDPLGQAKDAAARIARGETCGRLHGVPIGIKDNTLTADMPTTAGTTAPGVRFPLRDSAVAARLRAAGAILIGKTRTHEYAWGTVTPPVRNPWDRTRIPGGSSGRLGCRRRRRAVPGRDGDRHRRVDPHPRQLLRRRGAEAHLRPHQPRRHRAA